MGKSLYEAAWTHVAEVILRMSQAGATPLCHRNMSSLKQACKGRSSLNVQSLKPSTALRPNKAAYAASRRASHLLACSQGIYYTAFKLHVCESQTPCSTNDPHQPVNGPRGRLTLTDSPSRKRRDLSERPQLAARLWLFVFEPISRCKVETTTL